jgi:hypothetical protein
MNAIFVKFNRKDESSTFIFQIIKVQSQKKQEKTSNLIFYKCEIFLRKAHLYYFLYRTTIKYFLIFVIPINVNEFIKLRFLFLLQ